MVSLRNKIKGMFIGGAVGDAWGLAVETWTPEKILAVHPNGVPRYTKPVGHKWYKPDTPIGTTSDDTQLHIATVKGLIAGKEKADQKQSFDPYLDEIAKATVESMRGSVAGWGKTTQEAIRRLANGVHWRVSGKTSEKYRGTGNGVPMKCSSLAAWFISPSGSSLTTDNGKEFGFHQRLVDYSAMTHYSQISAHACVIHTLATEYCLLSEPLAFNPRWFCRMAGPLAQRFSQGESPFGANYDVSHLEPSDDDIFDPMTKLEVFFPLLPSMSRQEMVEQFGVGSCYVYESLPFAYAHFLQNPLSLSTIREVIEAGGDTDTNAKMVGELLGALNGIELFQSPANRWTIDELPEANYLLALADQFCDTFGIDP